MVVDVSSTDEDSDDDMYEGVTWADDDEDYIRGLQVSSSCVFERAVTDETSRTSSMRTRNC
jgi:hypothetical protein